MYERERERGEREREEREREREREMRMCICACYIRQLVAGISHKFPRVTVSCTVPACLLYATHDSLTIFLNNSKTKLQINFRKGKIVSEFTQEYVCFETPGSF